MIDADTLLRRRIREAIADQTGATVEDILNSAELAEIGVAGAEARTALLHHLAGVFSVQIDDEEAEQIAYLAQLFDLITSKVRDGDGEA